MYCKDCRHCDMPPALSMLAHIPRCRAVTRDTAYTPVTGRKELVACAEVRANEPNCHLFERKRSLLERFFAVSLRA